MPPSHPARHAAARLFTLLAALAMLPAACDRAPAPSGAGEVVVYCSADAPVAQPVFDAFQQATGITVRPVFDTEATKTTGLVNRLLAGHQRGESRADVWWSSEAFGTIRLSRAGALQPYDSPAADDRFRDSGGWPRELRGSGGDWYGFARRQRVLIYNTRHIAPEHVPARLLDLAHPRFRGRVGIARPHFGTTRGHMAAIHALDGGQSLRAWLAAMRDNDIRIFEGNAAVARAVGAGEVWLGLTDSDDAYVGRRSGWPVADLPIADICIEPWSMRPVPAPGPGARAPYPESPLQPPSTVAMLARAPHPRQARALIDFLLSEQAEALLAAGDFQAFPTRPPTLNQRLDAAAPAPASPPASRFLPISEVHFEHIADHVEPAMTLCDELLRGR